MSDQLHRWVGPVWVDTPLIARDEEGYALGDWVPVELDYEAAAVMFAIQGWGCMSEAEFKGWPEDFKADARHAVRMILHAAGLEAVDE